jgi:hypothetical protein
MRRKYLPESLVLEHPAFPISSNHISTPHFLLALSPSKVAEM